MTSGIRPIKCVIVGDGAVGKTSVLMSYCLEKFPYDYVPTVFDNYAANKVVNGQEYNLCLFDTAGQEAYESFRPLSYPNTDVFIVCFSVISPPSFANVKAKWIPEIRHFREYTPYIIVGNKIDARNDDETLALLERNKLKAIKSEQGEKMAKDVRAAKYMECSALTHVGLKELFEQAILVAIKPQNRKKDKKCILM